MQRMAVLCMLFSLVVFGCSDSQHSSVVSSDTAASSVITTAEPVPISQPGGGKGIERDVMDAVPGGALARLGDSGPLAADVPGDFCLLYTSPSPRDQRGSRMPSSA